MALSRRGFLKGALGAAALTTVAPFFIGKGKRAFARTEAFGQAKHLIYIRLSGGFRFTTAFNGNVAAQYNPFGMATNLAQGTEWGVSKLLQDAPYLNGDGAVLRTAGMRSVPEIANQITVVPCVDHEPTSAGADGNHGSGLERYWYGSVGGPAGLFTLINYGLRERFAGATSNGEVAIPAFCLGDAGMARGLGIYAAHRPPVVQSGSLDGFGLSVEDRVPSWARNLSKTRDERFRDRLRGDSRGVVDAYLETRKATVRFAEIFQSPVLQTGNGTDTIDGITNNELRAVFGDSGHARNLRLALRLFHFGCPAVYIDQGGYDMHSGEEDGLPARMVELSRIISGLVYVLNKMRHPSGGSFWDHTVVAFGSEFGRTSGGNRFNSARGSDHNGDNETRWMSMPFFGGPVANPGASLGATRASDLEATGDVVSYRSIMKSLLDVLGCEHQDLFPADPAWAPLFVG